MNEETNKWKEHNEKRESEDDSGDDYDISSSE